MKPNLFLLLRNADCKLCPLYQHAKTVCLIGSGAYPADLMLVGEAPGSNEDRLKQPFKGKAGELLDSILETLNIPRSDIFISNAVHCRPLDNAKPSTRDIRTCSSTYLTQEVKKVEPKLIIALGAVAAEGLLQKKVPVTTYRGKVWHTHGIYGKPKPVVITYHPAAVLRTPSLLDYLVKDFEFALQQMNGTGKNVEVNYRVAYTLTDYGTILREALKQGIVAVDLETEGFDTYSNKPEIISVQFCSIPGIAWYCRWNSDVAKLTKAIMENERIHKTTHFGKFDIKWLRQFNIRTYGPISDTAIELHLLDENFPSKDLESVASSFTPLVRHKVSTKDYVRRNKCKWSEIPLDIAVAYGCGDVDATLRLHQEFSKKIISMSMVPLFDLQMRGLRAFAEIERNGAKVDRILAANMAYEYGQKLHLLRDKFNFNPASNPKLKARLYDKWELPAYGPPKQWGGEPTQDTRKETLQELLRYEGLEPKQRRLIQRVLQYRKTSKLLSTYLVGITKHIRAGNKVHPNFRLDGAVTGRRSCTEPNLQNIPRQTDIKRIFISRYGRSGCIMQVDLSHADLRFAAFLSQEETLLSHFRSSNIDIHNEVAAKMLGLLKDQVTPEQRFKAKTINFLILYGGSANKAYEQLDSNGNRIFKSLHEAEKYVELWHEEFPAWHKYVTQVQQLVLKTGETSSPFGRIRRLPIIERRSPQAKEALRMAINSPIQGSVSDYTLLAICNLMDRLKVHKVKKCKVFAEVHDACLIDTIKSNVPVLLEIIQEEFEHADTSAFGFKLNLPMKCEISIGPNWGELEKVEH